MINWFVFEMVYQIIKQGDNSHWRVKGLELKVDWIVHHIDENAKWQMHVDDGYAKKFKNVLVNYVAETHLVLILTKQLEFI